MTTTTATPSPRRHRRIGRAESAAWVVAVVVWFAVLATGARTLYAYETTAGASAGTPASWPSASALQRGDGFTIVMFVHPDCTCSRASLAELAAIADAAGGVALIETVFVGGSGAGDNWDAADAVRGGVRVVDRDGVEAARFGAQTSGHVVVYSPDGELVFSGGITGSRGHPGDNVGRRDVIAAVAGDRWSTHPSHAVFGCALWGSDRRTR